MSHNSQVEFIGHGMTRPISCLMLFQTHIINLHYGSILSEILSKVSTHSVFTTKPLKGSHIDYYQPV